jgi:hypothetical protein
MPISFGGAFIQLNGMAARAMTTLARWSTGTTGGQAVNDTDEENKIRNREIAQNESTRQTIGDIRVSAWAVAAAVVIGLAAVGWVLLHNN